MKCFECNIPMNRTDCPASPEGVCGIHECPKCNKTIHSKRGSKGKLQKIMENKK